MGIFCYLIHVYCSNPLFFNVRWKKNVLLCTDSILRVSVNCFPHVAPTDRQTLVGFDLKRACLVSYIGVA